MTLASDLPAHSRPGERMVGVALAVWATALTAILALPSLLRWPTAGEELTRNTVRLSLAYYTVSVSLMIFLSPAGWTALTRRGQLARCCWTLAWVSFLVHLATAIHFYDHWSHAEALRRTHEATGFGEGIYVSHLFTLLWAGDVAWWWLGPRSYGRRRRSGLWALHGFMAAMIFCGTVVYETGPIRWAGLAMFAWLGFLLGSRFLTRPRGVP